MHEYRTVRYDAQKEGYMKSMDMTDDDLKQWDILRKQLKNGYHMEKSDLQELVRLNHLVLEVTSEIHNMNMRNELYAW